MGEDEMRALKVRTASLYCIRYLMGSQCKAGSLELEGSVGQGP